MVSSVIVTLSKELSSYSELSNVCALFIFVRHTVLYVTGLLCSEDRWVRIARNHADLQHCVCVAGHPVILGILHFTYFVLGSTLLPYIFNSIV